MLRTMLSLFFIYKYVWINGFVCHLVRLLIGSDVNTLYSTFRTRYDNAFDVMNLLITC